MEITLSELAPSALAFLFHDFEDQDYPEKAEAVRRELVAGVGEAEATTLIARAERGHSAFCRHLFPDGW